jgi:phospholipase C
MAVKSLISVLALAAVMASEVAPAGAAGLGDSSPADGRDAPAAEGLSPEVATGPRGKIKHVVIIVQENRTPDNLFHGLPSADIASQGVDSKGKIITLAPIPLRNNYDLGHSHGAFLDAMHGADQVAVSCKVPTTACPPPHPQFRYVDPADVAPYFELAQTYTFGDRMFQSNQGPSFPAHQYLIAGTSTPTAGGAFDNDLASENPRRPRTPVGCVKGPPGQHVPLIDPQGVEDFRGVYPCFEHPTMMDLLDQAGHSWSYYAAGLTGIRVAPNAIEHLRTGADWSKVKSPPTQVLTDIVNGTLSEVSWVTPTTASSDHPAYNDGSGPSWVAAVVNALGASSYWPDTAIFVTWADWGGWYDHVLPPHFSSYELGFRVPLLVISPFAKKGYVSHVGYSFGSILRFMEETYNLPSLGYQDASSDDMSDCFDFTQAIMPFNPIKADHDAAFFIKRSETEPLIDADED